MNWDECKNLIKTLDLNYIRLEFFNEIHINHMIKANIEVLSKINYFKDKFYVQLLKMSNYMHHTYGDVLGEYVISIHIDNSLTKLRYEFFDLTVNQCLRLQNTIKDIAGTPVRISFKLTGIASNTEKCDLFFDIRYNDIVNDVEILDLIDIDMLRNIRDYIKIYDKHKNLYKALNYFIKDYEDKNEFENLESNISIQSNKIIIKHQIDDGDTISIVIECIDNYKKVNINSYNYSEVLGIRVDKNNIKILEGTINE